MTRDERRWKLEEALAADTEYCMMVKAYESAEAEFKKITNSMPENIRNLLWSFPGMGYLLHGRILTIVCEHMRFPDEDENTPQP